MPYIEAWPNPFIAPSTTSRMPMHFDLLPASTVDYGISLPRVRVDGTEVLVRPGLQINESEQDAGLIATFTLVDETQKSLFTASASIDVGLGELDSSGAWVSATMKWEIQGGCLESLSDDKQGPPNDVQDAVSITVASQRDSRLNKSSITGLTIYDPSRVTVRAEDFKDIPTKNQAVSFSRTIEAQNGLTVGDLFQRVLITECGFTTYKTNLPVNDWPVQRYDVDLGQRFFDGLKGFWGCHSPAIKISDDGTEISILDSTIAQPSGFPAARQITVNDITGIQTQTETAGMDGLMMGFVGLENNYDYTTIRFVYATDTNGNTQTDSEQIIIEYRKITSPTTNIIVREALNIESKTTTINGVEQQYESDVFEFNASGDYSHRRKQVHTLLPNLPTSDAPFFRPSLEENESYGYAPHPFKPQQKYLQRRDARSTGLITVDADNPNIYGDPAEQPAFVAVRSNNIAEGQTLRDGSLWTETETAEPLRDGTVRVRQRKVDEVTNTVLYDKTDIRAGEVGTSAVSTTQQQMLILPEGETALTGDRVISLNVGELPLKYAIPLAERRLAQIQTANRRGTVPFIGYDATLKKGTLVSIYDRDSNAIGNFIILGRSITTNENGLIATYSVREVPGTAAALQYQGPYSSSIESEGVWQGILPIECLDGFVLTIDPSTVANVTIEARHVESPEAAWVDLESNVIDLSPYTLTDEQDFEFRITAGTVTVSTAVDFDLVVHE